MYIVTALCCQYANMQKESIVLLVVSSQHNYNLLPILATSAYFAYDT